MLVFQVSSRIVQAPGPLKKHRTRAYQRGYAVMRHLVVVALGSALITLLIQKGTNNFLLLPVLVSLIWAQPKNYNVKALLDSTPIYLFLTFCLNFIYYGAITEGILLAERTITYHIAFVTTALAWAIMFEPARAYLQSLVERYFNTRNREAAKAIDAFTITLREEIHLAQLQERFFTLIQQNMQPYFVSLAMRPLHQQQPHSNTLQEMVIADDDPLLAYMQTHPHALELDYLQFDSPALQDLKLHRADILLPLATQGDLVGLLILGSHLKGEAYTREEITMLETLAPQVAPALRVSQIVQEQQVQEREYGRIEQELLTAQDIQRTFLPKNVPVLPGWKIAPYYQPAREVGGDFYDFLPFADGRLGLIIGDVTDKGIPAALVMTATRTMLRTAALKQTPPGEVLARVNELLYADIPARMFVTCFYAILDPADGRLVYANAGHDLPYRRHHDGVSELWATGMPLGMMPGTDYEEQEVTLAPGESILFYSDGLVEAHNQEYAMFDYSRLSALLSTHSGGPELIDFLLHALATFTGSDWEQEDDVTLVTLQRLPEIPEIPALTNNAQSLKDSPSSPQSVRLPEEAHEPLPAVQHPMLAR